MIDRFRREVYQSFEQRADSGMDLIDALTSALTVESPVAQSESALFRRRFSSVYDFLKRGRIQLFSTAPGVESEPTAGCGRDSWLRNLRRGLHRRSGVRSRDASRPNANEEGTACADRGSASLLLVRPPGGMAHVLVHAPGCAAGIDREYRQCGGSGTGSGLGRTQ